MVAVLRLLLAAEVQAPVKLVGIIRGSGCSGKRWQKKSVMRRWWRANLENEMTLTQVENAAE